MFGDMMGMMGKMKEALAKMEETKRKLDDIHVRGESPSQLIIITLTANRQIVGIEVDENFRKHADSEEFADYMGMAMSEAMRKADEVSREEMEKVTNDMLPGGMGALKSMLG
jgi:hypothetical protein